MTTYRADENEISDPNLYPCHYVFARWRQQSLTAAIVPREKYKTIPYTDPHRSCHFNTPRLHYIRYGPISSAGRGEATFKGPWKKYNPRPVIGG